MVRTKAAFIPRASEPTEWRTNMNLNFTAAFVAATLLATPVIAGDFDGTWTGRWSATSTAKIRIVDDKVTAYHFKGRSQKVGPTTRKGKKLVFGTDYRITITLTGKSSAHASYRTNGGSAEADLVRK